MTITDLVKVDGFITRSDKVPLYRQERERRLAGHASASTLGCRRRLSWTEAARGDSGGGGALSV
ncbi:hypothetical protein [Caballeronia insecticola]|uniref:hypothetical protein n=1 Tax=Caballeronia insecticola TaxID=758793 RepID=UPI00118300CA|nr:hypothetical protein [Caballeronia insecticola]